MKVAGKKGVDVESKTGNEEGAYYDTLDKHANFHLLSAQRDCFSYTRRLDDEEEETATKYVDGEGSFCGQHISIIRRANIPVIALRRYIKE